VKRLSSFTTVLPTTPAANTELKMLPAYSLFLHIVGQAISSLKAVIKEDISRPRNTGSNGLQSGGQTRGLLGGLLGEM